MAFVNFKDIYLVVGDTAPTTQVYSTASIAYVANNVAAYDTWLNAGNLGFFSDVTAKANNAGLVRLTLDASQLQTGQRWLVNNVSADANGIWTITKIDATHVDLQGSTYNAGSTFPSGALPKLQGAAIVATDAAMRAAINGYNITTSVPNASVSTPAVNITLTNPMASRINFTPTVAISVFLPVMNAPNSPAIGDTFEITNDGDFNISLRNTGGVVLGNVAPRRIFRITLTDNSTANGTFTISFSNSLISYYRGRVFHFVAANNVTTPNTQIDISADWMTCSFQGVGEPFIGTTGSATLNMATAGPVANGRDQAGVFGASNWIHVYGIARAADNNTANFAVIASLSAVSPTLPTGYVAYTYLFSVYWTSGSILPPVTVRGNLVTYTNAGTTGVALSAGAAVGATPTTAVSVTTLVPPNADNIQVQGLVSAGAGSSQTVVGTTSGSTIANPVAASNSWAGFTAMLPNVNQNLYYNNSLAPATTYINILGYTVPNGG